VDDEPRELRKIFTREDDVNEINDLEKLREREARLETEIADEKRELGIRTHNLIGLTEQLSDCKKAIGALTVGKMETT
jgi:uncharacterized protein involved in exopolysaccharide biosynthesis